MENESRSSSESSNSPDSRESELGILPILIISLFVGLIAGAGMDKSHILPVAFIVAIVLFINRKKIAAEDAAKVSGNDTEYTTETIETTEKIYVWPKLGRFIVSVSAQSFQSAIRQLAQENRSLGSALELKCLPMCSELVYTKTGTGKWAGSL